MSGLLRWCLFCWGGCLILFSGLILRLPRPVTHLMMVSEAGSTSIRAVLPESGEVIPVTDGQTQRKFFSWSPDGKWILYSAQDSGIINLYRKRLNGYRSEVIEDFPASSFFYSWSPDNTWLVSYFINQNLDKDFYRMRPDGSEAARFQLANMDRILAWSSDWMLASTYNRGVIALYRVYPFANRAEYLLGDITDDTFKTLSADGTWLVFASPKTGRLHRLSLEDGSITPLLPESEPDRFQAVSAEWLVFTGDDSLYRLSLDTGELQFLGDVSDCSFVDFLATSPHGDEMIFWCGYDRLHRLDLSTGQISLVVDNLPNSGTLYFYNAWSQDSRWVLFSAFQNDIRSLYVLDMHTGAFQRMTDSQRSETFVTWTPDSEWAIISEFLAGGQIGGKFSLFRTRPDGSEPRLLTHEPTYFTGWSPPFDADYRAWITAPGGCLLCLAAVLLQRRRDKVSLFF